ncbi:MAG: FliH/SctL family protein [Actinomycetes bacterium]
MSTSLSAPAPRAGADYAVRPALGPGAVAAGDAAREHAIARAAGYAAGWSQGAQAAQATARRELDVQQARLEQQAAGERQQLSCAARALSDAAAQLRATVLPSADDVTDAVLEAALRLAAAVLGHEPVASSAPGRDALRRALAASPAAVDISVRLSPEDAATLSGEDAPEGVCVVPDPGLARGDAVVDHGLGRVEVRLQDALRRAQEVLLP